MTKRRRPLTFENALTKVAAVIGWDEAAKIVRQAERTVRNWSEPDTSASISLDHALALDVAYHANGGDGAPFLDCYQTRLEVQSMAAVPGREALIESAARSSKEHGEAVSATLSAARPSATRADFDQAEREIEESIAASQEKLRCLRARRLAVETGEDPDGARASEVALTDA